MHYWDASALVPLCIQEPLSANLRQLAATVDIVTWFSSVVEIASAIERRQRERALDSEAYDLVKQNLRELSGSWFEVSPTTVVRDRALRLLATHPLRSADALQLAAALVTVSDRPGTNTFVCCDLRLRGAAGREGFATVSGS